MTSKARKAFDDSCSDIDRLLEIHHDLGGTSRGRRYRLEVLNKSAIVLLCALWEAYCEDVASEGIAHLVAHAGDWKDLPKDLQKRVAKDIKNEPHELAVWNLAGDGWRTILKTRLKTLTDERNTRLNTPKTAQIDALFADALGIPKISSAWSWPGASARQNQEKLDRNVALRGAIAHRGASATAVSKNQVETFYLLVQRLVEKTGGRVNSTVSRATGRPLW